MPPRFVMMNCQCSGLVGYPQAVVAQAKPDFCITHAPGAMLITDLFNHQLASF